MTYDEFFEWLREEGCLVERASHDEDVVVRNGPSKALLPKQDGAAPVDPDIVQQTLISLRIDRARLPNLGRQ